MKILFICTHNACRSILSEAIARQLGRGRIQVASAGSNPATQVHPLTLAYLRDRGYRTDGLHCKSIDALGSFGPQAVVTVCDQAAQEPCPVWLGTALKVHWGLPDPSRQAGSDQDRAECFARVIATIEQRIARLLEQPFETMDAEQLTCLLGDAGGQG
ncbi:MAG: arsenate reductase ArsC [Gammaproteobacteria bacterium]|nr:arsenate reductase ArsC [Gammaproteobacteria bacterium]MBK6582874.1 arsenate reductase ArsC [Gammaproteobacteria bacterium]MBK7730256.1 arsenate reductase ArsC [Gammaproteobacteria bacterium]MBK9665892.1 arsenate reductase ArsC [Gammaproteobacteria bacterium]